MHQIDPGKTKIPERVIAIKGYKSQYSNLKTPKQTPINKLPNPKKWLSLPFGI
jgi:hypothetical protein